MTYHPDDQRALELMLGKSGELPEPLEAEYNLRRRMLDAAGQTGRVGPVALVDMVRSLGYAPPKQAEVAKLDLQKLPQDGSVRVKTLRYGSWMEGVFVGRGENGTAHVRLDSDGVVYQISNRPDVLRLDDDYVEPEPELPRLALLEGERQQVAPEDVGEAAAAVLEPELPAEQPEAAHAASEPPEDDETAGEHDWAGRAAGTAVEVLDDGEPVNGKLSHTDEAGQVFVLVEGEETARAFDAEDVFLGG